jgi:hypothetical protein
MTTIFVPVSRAQADWSFLNRQEAFKRGFDTGGDGILQGFCNREDAIDAEKGEHISPFAVLRISFDNTMHERLAYAQQLRATDGGHWLVKPEGCAVLAQQAELLMEVVPGGYVQSMMQRVDVFETPHRASGPTGFYGC